jgi:nucleotide-binding universal stress UspA family protein
MYQKILIALEGQEADEAVLSHVQALAAQTKARVTLLRVIAVADDGGGGLGTQFQLEIGSSGWRRKKQAVAYLSRLERRLQALGLLAETALVIGTRPVADEIVSYADTEGFDLIAMASDSRPWYKRLIYDSQDDDVMRKATVPTLFVGANTRQAPVTPTLPEVNPVMAALGTAEL